MGCRSLRRGGVIAGAGEMQPPKVSASHRRGAAGRFGEAETHGRSPWRGGAPPPPPGRGPPPPPPPKKGGGGGGGGLFFLFYFGVVVRCFGGRRGAGAAAPPPAPPPPPPHPRTFPLTVRGRWR